MMGTFRVDSGAAQVGTSVIVPSRPERRLGRGDTWALRLGETAHLTARIGITRTGRHLPTELAPALVPRPDDDQPTR
jgi:hypothetical protein